MPRDSAISRADLSCDVVNCSISDLIVRSTILGKRHVYFGYDEEVETIYLAISKGQKNSSHYLYNKRQQLREADRALKYGGIPWTRVETRIKANRPIVKLGNILKNPLTVFEMFYPDLASPPEEPHHWMFFAEKAMSACRRFPVM